MSSTPNSPPGNDVTEQRGPVPPAAGGRPPGPAGAPPPSEGRAPDEAAADAAQEAIADLRARIAALEQDWRRALADADNLRKRFARDIERIRAEERANAARRFLPVVDNLDRALEHAGSDPQAIIEGVRAVREQAIRVLADLGYPRRDDTGEAFDPKRHDAVGSTPGNGAPPGTVVQVVQPGYGEGEQQLRPATVLVAEDR
jgi:molecular chaperone GrpE